jgi:hypothetical protein
MTQMTVLSVLVLFGHRIAALVDFALQALGLFPGGGDRPIIRVGHRS